jgi:pimeloyl-ACP methyl ester carboxylesterase
VVTIMPSPDGFRSRWTDLGAHRIHERFRLGPATQPIVLLHGLAVSHRYLMPTARFLAAGHPVIVPDLCGFGHSDKPTRAYDVTAHAAVLADWLDARGLTGVCLVGHSFGAEIAARLAADRPDLAAGLVLAGPTCDPLGRSRRGLLRRGAADLLVEAPWQAAVLARDIADAGPWRVLATVGHSVRNAIEHDLRRLRVAPLVLGGALDPIAPLLWRASVAAMTGGRSVTIPGAAHNVLTTAGRRSADAIGRYVGLGSGTGAGATPASSRPGTRSPAAD